MVSLLCSIDGVIYIDFTKDLMEHFLYSLSELAKELQRIKEIRNSRNTVFNNQVNLLEAAGDEKTNCCSEDGQVHKPIKVPKVFI